MELAAKLEKILYRVKSPARYMGNEWNSIQKEWDSKKTRVLLAFPDLYEIGMSHLGLKILYHLLNREDDLLAERCYAPWLDLEKLLRTEELPLFSLESKRPVNDFDLFGFTLQYEMSYTNIINMLDLAGLPLYSKDRNQEHPLVIAGGSTVFNPEPLAPFIDLFFIGEAEEGIVQLVRHYRELRDAGLDRKELLPQLNQLAGVYVPALYRVDYRHNHKIKAITPIKPAIKAKIKRVVVANLDQAFYPIDFIVPFVNIVHDRAVIEVARGCSRGCRFCAAGISYRPVRERKQETIIALADQILASTGYEELSLTSLSTADYSGIAELLKTLSRRYQEKRVSISLSSLRVDEFSVNLAKEVQRVRKSGLTFAPEAGTQRLRDIINKGVSEEDLYAAVRAAFAEGWSTIKLYFMIGLPGEREEDLQGIVDLAKRVLAIGQTVRKQRKVKMKKIKINISVSTFIPKPFTPFQWVEMVSIEQIKEKQDFLRSKLRGHGLSLNWNNPRLSMLEGVFSRGDRRLAAVLERAWEKGCRFDGWNEHFSFSDWQEAFRENGLKMEDFTGARELGETLPWEHINMGVSKQFLEQEYQKALRAEQTGDCRFNDCTDCAVCFQLRTGREIMGGAAK